MSVFCHCNVMLSFFIWRYMFELVSGQCLFARRQNQDVTVYSCVCPACLSVMPLCLSAQYRGVYLHNTRESNAQCPCVCLLCTRVSSCSMSVRLFSLCPCVCLLNTYPCVCFLTARVYQYVCSIPVCLSDKWPSVCLLNARVCLSVQCYCVCQLLQLCLPA